MKKCAKVPVDSIIQGNTLDILKALPDECVDMVVTSPPYWRIRTYEIPPQSWKDGWKGELGMEPYFYQYVDHLCDIFDEIKRVLKDTGTIWINLGDTYAGSNHRNNDHREKTGLDVGPSEPYRGQKAVWVESLTAKSLCQIPNRFAIEMTDRGWILRNELIWWKPNGLPCPVNDRFPVDYEKIFFSQRVRNTSSNGNSTLMARTSWRQECDRPRNMATMATALMRIGTLTRGKNTAGAMALTAC